MKNTKYQWIIIYGLIILYFIFIFCILILKAINYKIFIRMLIIGIVSILLAHNIKLDRFRNHITSFYKSFVFTSIFYMIIEITFNFITHLMHKSFDFFDNLGFLEHTEGFLIFFFLYFMILVKKGGNQKNEN